MKKDYGYYKECFTVVEDVPILAVAWKNKIVHVSSTFVDELDKNVVTRFNEKRPLFLFQGQKSLKFIINIRV